jgi:hypothetical protein
MPITVPFCMRVFVEVIVESMGNVSERLECGVSNIRTAAGAIPSAVSRIIPI